MNYYLMAFKKYADFGGVATRNEFWAFWLLNCLFLAAGTGIDHLLGTCFKYDMGHGVKVLPVGYTFAIYALITLLPAAAVLIRRLHDVGKSGWFMFIALVPVVGDIWLLVLCCTKSKVTGNKYLYDTVIED